MLADSNVMASVVVKDGAAGKAFYQGKLGLNLLSDNDAMQMYQCGTGRLVVYPSDTAGTNKGTSAMWEVDDVKAVVDELKGKGVAFEHYDMPFGKWEGDVMVSEIGDAAWFKDPDGNILSLVSAAKKV